MKHDPRDANADSRLPLAKKKATSFARPYHTLDELLGLPSRFNSTSDVSLNEPIQAFPSLTVLIDCVNTDYPLGGARKSSLNSVLETLWSQKIQPSSICVLVSPDNYPRTNPSLFGYSEGTTKIYTLSGYDEEFVLKTPFSTIQSEYVLLLECPPLQEYKQPTVNDTDFLVKTVRIAGTDQYSSSALTFSGLARSPLQFESSGFIAYGNQPVPDGYLHDENSEVIYHELKESRQVAVPHGALLLQSNWLNGLREGVIQARGALKMVTRGLVETIGRRLNDQLHIKTWALPISGFSLYDNAVRSELLDLAKRLPQDYLRPSNNDEHRDATLGSSAKVAILLSERDLEYAQAWESITCGFADETIYGHEVRLYTDLSEAETHPVILGCPEVEVLPLRPSLIQAWQPDVCLTTMQMQIDDMMVGLSALHIEIPDTDLIHVDWLVALPLESLLSKSRKYVCPST